MDDKGLCSIRHYHNAFVNAACECPRVLIAGYSDNDPHISAWIMEGRRLHADDWRGMIIDKTPCLPTFSVLPRMWPLGGNDGDFPPTGPNNIQKIIEHLAG
jgi:hypothetical protein